MEVLIVLWLLSWEIDTANQVQILDKAVCISYCANTLGKVINPIILAPVTAR